MTCAPAATTTHSHIPFSIISPTDSNVRARRLACWFYPIKQTRSGAASSTSTSTSTSASTHINIVIVVVARPLWDWSIILMAVMGAHMSRVIVSESFAQMPQRVLKCYFPAARNDTTSRMSLAFIMIGVNARDTTHTAHGTPHQCDVMRCGVAVPACCGAFATMSQHKIKNLHTLHVRYSCSPGPHTKSRIAERTSATERMHNDCRAYTFSYTVVIVRLQSAWACYSYSNICIVIL